MVASTAGRMLRGRRFDEHAATYAPGNIVVVDRRVASADESLNLLYRYITGCQQARNHAAAPARPPAGGPRPRKNQCGRPAPRLPQVAGSG